MIGEYTMNEYKAYKALVKHKRRINRVFSEVCGDKSFNSRGPDPKLKVPAVVVASCSAAPINAPRIRSSKRGSSSVNKGTSSGVKPSKTRSLESSKRKRKTSERTSDAELQAASGLAKMNRKKLKKAVRKVSSVGVRRVPSAFDDDAFEEADSQKGVCFWPLFNFRDNCPSGSENEFVDVDSFSNAAPKVRKEAVPDAADEAIVEAKITTPAEAPAAAEVPAADISQAAHSRDEASPEFAKELELTVQRGENLHLYRLSMFQSLEFPLHLLVFSFQLNEEEGRENIATSPEGSTSGEDSSDSGERGSGGSSSSSSDEDSNDGQASEHEDSSPKVDGTN
jgi:hypothetical protein